MLKYSKSGTGKVGRHLQYQDDIAYGMEVGRMPIFFTPEKDNVSDGNVLRFVLPAKGNIDFTKSSLSFTINPPTAKPGTGTWTNNTMEPGSWSICNRARVLCGSTQIQQIDRFNLLTNWRALTEGGLDAPSLSVPGATGTVTAYPWWSFALNLSDQGDRQLTESRNMIMPLNLESLTAKVLPLGAIKESIIIEFYLEDASNVFAKIVGTDTGRPTYSINDCRLHAYELTLPKSYNDTIQAQVDGGGLQLKFNDWTHFSTTITTAQSTTLITEKACSVKTIVAIPRQVSVLSDNTLDGKSWVWDGTGLRTYQFKLDNKYYPADPVDCFYTSSSVAYEIPDGDLIYHHADALGKWDGNGLLGSLPQYNPIPAFGAVLLNKTTTSAPDNLAFVKHFSLVYNFEGQPHSGLVTGTDTTTTTTNFQLILNEATAPNKQWDFFVKEDAIFYLGKQPRLVK